MERPFRSFLTLLLVAAGLHGGTVETRAATETLTMDVLPEEEGWTLLEDTYDPGSAEVHDGILTITTSPSYRCYSAPDSWNDTVHNGAGWSIEFRMKVVSCEPVYPEANIVIWVNDRTYLTILAFETDKMFIQYPTWEVYPMDTTDDFHVYRIEGQATSFHVFVDGALAIDYETLHGSGSQLLGFGDFAGFSASVTQWDFFTYTTEAPIPVEPSTWGAVKALYR